MKLIISSTGKDMDDSIDPRFGRCSYYIAYDTEKDTYEAVENKSRNATGGAGIQASQAAADLGADAVITTNMGPNAFRVLETAGIKVYSGVTGTVRKAVEDFKKGSLGTTEKPNVGEKFGMGGSN
jgi:predicted Fe-Mo cluster-binding NifX family protein